MTLDQWIAVLLIFLPLTSKAAVELAAYLTLRKHTALAAIVGMAGRQAADIARVLKDVPAGTDRITLERALIDKSTDTILTEMAPKVGILQAGLPEVMRIVQSELNKRIVPLLAVTAETRQATTG